MKQLLVAAAVVGLATAGCAQNGMLGRSSCPGGNCRVARSQLAPRPNIMRTACRDGACGCDACGCGVDCNCGTNCSDGCCGQGGCAIGGRLAGRLRGCGACGGAGCGLCRSIAADACPHSGGYPEVANFNPSPPTGQTAYPYYTVRGPRDFLQPNPPSIGPN